MTEPEVRKLQELAGKAEYLARLRDHGSISEEEYIRRLNHVRKEYGLWPIRISSEARKVAK